jgi:hypothetical protein
MTAQNTSANSGTSTGGAGGGPRSGGRYRLLFRLIGIPIIAAASLFIYNGLRDHFVLPDCDSARAERTLSGVLKQLKYEPVRHEPIKTVSRSRTEVVCKAILPLADGGSVVADFTFYWQGDQANMKYSIHRQPVP